jgi:Opacity protein and related surface antigens
MKKIAITALFAFAFLLPAHSQVHFGITLDPQVSWLSSDRKKVEGDGYIPGIAFGLNIDRYFAERYAVYTGVFIESTGGYLKYNTTGFTLDTKDRDGYVINQGESMKYRLQYLTAPIGIKLKTNPIGYNTFYANLGFKTSILLKSKGFSGSGHTGADAMDGEVLDGEMNYINLGYQIGAGTEYSLGGNVALIFGVTYNNGLTNTVNNSSLHINLNNISFKLGVMF